MTILRSLLLTYGLLTSVSLGQITVPPETPDRHPIIASVQAALIPEDADVTGPGWILPKGVRTLPDSSRYDTTIPIWADPGDYVISFEVLWIHFSPLTFTDGSGKEITIQQYLGHDSIKELATFKVLGKVVEPKPDPDDPVDPVDPKGLNQAIYLYERDEGGISTDVRRALSEINAEGEIIARPLERNETDGDGNVSERYAVAYEAGMKFQRPCLILVFDDDKTKVLTVETYEDIMKAVKDND